MKRQKLKRVFRSVIICILIFLIIHSINYYQDVGTKAFATIEKNQRFNMSYAYFGNTQSYLKAVDRTKGSLNMISPSFLDIKEDGSLVVKVDPQFVATMQNQGIKVVPFLSNHWNRSAGREALKNSEQLASQVAQVIEQFQLDGVNVDIENVTEIDRDNYTLFVKLLRAKIPKHKEVSVAVAANPKGWNKGWHGSYDYPKLAEYSDYLMIMSYDESYEGGTAGPVASLSFVEQSVQYALNQGVHSQKIVLGIPFFGRYWNNFETTGGKGISINRVDELVRFYNGKVELDRTSHSPKASFTITEKDEKKKIGGRELTVGNYTIWYENDYSIRQKLFLVSKYNLKGSGSWSLGQEHEALWKYYSFWLRGKPFVDTEGHWAEEDIYQISYRGWMKGTTEHHFSPGKSLTRAEAAVIIARSLQLKPTEKHVAYTDVSSKYWAKKEIELVSQYGIMRGIKEGKFGPETKLTREQLAVILARNFGISAEKNGETLVPFKDISPNHWAYLDIMAMYQHGLMKGTSAGKFGIKQDVDRAQKAVMMNRLSKRLEK